MTVSVFEAYATDRDQEEEGVWHTLRYGLRARIARSSSRRSIRALNRAKAPYKEMYDAAADGDEDAVPVHIDEQVTAKWIAHGLVLDWEGPNGEPFWLGENGEELRFSPETCEFILMDPRMKDLRGDILVKARQGAAYKAKREEKLEKNSSSGSPGTTTRRKSTSSSSSASDDRENVSAH